MPDQYTTLKRQVQGQFLVGSLAEYSGQRTALHGTVKVVGHEAKGGIIIDADGVRAVVSPFSLMPTAAARPPGRGKRPEAPQNGHTPTARIFRHGVPLVPPNRTKTPVTTQTVETDALARLRRIGQPPAPPPVAAAPAPPAAAPTLTVPLGRGNVEAFYFRWLRDFRRTTPHATRQGIIDGFDLPTYLRDRVPAQPGFHQYKTAIYFVTAVGLADPSRLPAPAALILLLAARFRVTPEAVGIHLKWMRARLEADHAAFVATTVGVTQ